MVHFRRSGDQLIVVKLLHVIAAVRLIICFTLPSAPQTAPKPPSLPLLVNVLDKDANPVKNLTASNFQVRLKGHQLPVLDAAYNAAPRRIVVLLDMSGSMSEGSENKKWPIAREALDELLTETPAAVQLALVTFSSHVHDVFDFKQGRSSLGDWLKRGSSQRRDIKGTTALFDAVAAAAKMLEPARSGDAIYAITDAGDNSSHATRSDIENLLLRSGVRLFLFLFSEPSPLTEEGMTSAVALARETGGFVFGVIGTTGTRGLQWSDFSYDDGPNTRERIRLYTRALNLQVNGFYTLRVDAPAPTRKASKISVDVTDATGKVTKNVALTYQQRIPASVQ
jgi:von Willebrand factor type A domain